MSFILSTDGDIDFILAPAVGSLTTASTGTSQGPSTSTIPGTYCHLSCSCALYSYYMRSIYSLCNGLPTIIVQAVDREYKLRHYILLPKICVMLVSNQMATLFCIKIVSSPIKVMTLFLKICEDNKKKIRRNHSKYKHDFVSVLFI